MSRPASCIQLRLLTRKHARRHWRIQQSCFHFSNVLTIRKTDDFNFFPLAEKHSLARWGYTKQAVGRRWACQSSVFESSDLRTTCDVVQRETGFSLHVGRTINISDNRGLLEHDGMAIFCQMSIPEWSNDNR